MGKTADNVIDFLKQLLAGPALPLVSFTLTLVAAGTRWLAYVWLGFGWLDRIFVLFSCFLILLACASAFYYLNQRFGKPWLNCVGVPVSLIAVALFGLGLSGFWPHVDAFRSLYSQYRSDLGDPVSPQEDIYFVYDSQHQSERIIYTSNDFRFIFLKRSGWSSCPDESWDTKDSTLIDDVKLAKEFRSPLGSSPALGPPFSGVAKLWREDRIHWQKDMGWRQWHTIYYHQVAKQRFSHGELIGPICQSDDCPSNAPTVLMLIRSPEAPKQSTKCVDAPILGEFRILNFVTGHKITPGHLPGSSLTPIR
jgi:hypothetical protein